MRNQPHGAPYLRTSVWELARHRIIWLAVLMLSATVTGVVLQRYEEAFLAIPLLVSLFPCLPIQAECCSQSATLIIRGMAVDEIRPNDFFKVLWKEFRISLVVGSILGPQLRTDLPHSPWRAHLIPDRFCESHGCCGSG